MRQLMRGGRFGFFMFLLGMICIYKVASAQQSATDFFKIAVNSMKYSDYNNTIFFATKAIELNPKFGAAYWNRAIAYDYKGDYHASINDYDSALKYYANSIDLTTLHKNRGMVYNDMREYDSAIIDFNKALALTPDYPLAYWNRGIAEDGIDRSDSAVKDYTRALEDFVSVNDICQLHLLRGLAYKKLKKNEKSNAEFKEILKLDTAHDYHRAYAKYILETPDSARYTIRTAIVNAKGNADAYMNAYFDAARLFSVMNNKEKAIGCLEMSFDLGYKRFNNVDGRDFDNFRDDPEFVALVKKYKDMANKPSQIIPLPKKPVDK